MNQLRDKFRFHNAFEAGKAAYKIIKNLSETPSTADKMPQFTYEPMIEAYEEIQQTGWLKMSNENRILMRVILQSLWSTPSMQDKLPKYVYEPLMMLQDYVNRNSWDKVLGLADE